MSCGLSTVWRKSGTEAMTVDVVSLPLARLQFVACPERQQATFPKVRPCNSSGCIGGCGASRGGWTGLQDRTK